MKKTLLLLAATICSSVGFAQNSIPNGNFENWLPVNYMTPEFYESGNENSVKDSIITAERITDAYHGSYAVKLTTRATSDDTLTAYITNGDPGNPAGTGIPYTEQATGIRGYYKANIMNGDTANLFVFFKKNGVMIGQYLFKIYGSQSNYTLFNFSFSPALPIAPDSIIWGATPSNVLAAGGNFRGIPGSTLTLDSISFTGVTTQPAMLNGDFETWTTSTFLLLPGWDLDETSTPRTTDKNSGLYALEVETTMQDWGVHNGNATTGKSTQTGTIGGSPFTNQEDTLAFYYKYTAADINDSATVSLMFKKNGSFIGMYGKKLPAAANYTYVEIPFNLPQVPDSVILSVSSSKSYPTPASYIGSMAKFDDFHFKSQMAPVADFTAPASVCANDSFLLIDNSTNSPSGWEWTMTGATPSSSNIQNPMASYGVAGTYTVTLVSSNGAGQSSPVSKQIVVLPQPVVGFTISPNDTICEGDGITLTGTGTSNSVWNNGVTDMVPFNPTASGMYIVTGTDINGCTNSDTVDVVVNPLPVVSFTVTPDDTVCTGEMITLSGTGAVDYMWTGGITNATGFIANTNAMYIVTGEDVNGCVYYDTAFVAVNALPTVGITAMPNDTVCDNQTLVLNGTGADSYVWNNSVTDGVAFSPSTGNYIVTGTDANGCVNSDTIAIVVEICVGVNELNTNSFKVYPNPAKGSVTLELQPAENSYEISLTDLSGRIVMKKVIASGISTATLKLDEIQSGVYFINVVRDSKITGTSKLILE